MSTSTYLRCQRVLRYRYWHEFSKKMTVTLFLCLCSLFLYFVTIGYLEKEQQTKALSNLLQESSALHELYGQFGVYLSKNEKGASLFGASEMIRQIEPYLLFIGVPEKNISYLERYWFNSNWTLLGNERHLAFKPISERLCENLSQTPAFVNDLNSLIKQLSLEGAGEIFCYYHNAFTHADPLTKTIFPESSLRKTPVAVVLLEPGERQLPVNAIEKKYTFHLSKTI